MCRRIWQSRVVKSTHGLSCNLYPEKAVEPLCAPKLVFTDTVTYQAIPSSNVIEQNVSRIAGSPIRGYEDAFLDPGDEMVSPGG